MDKEKGFFLNGKSYPLHGVSRHQDRKGLGNALTLEHMKEDLSYIKEIGANTIRLAHYQHNQKVYDLCDEMGFVLWAEIPYISEHMPNDRARENVVSQMKELVIQNFNHPSIVTWGLSNEITIKVTNKKDMIEEHKKLNKMVKELDETRPTSIACYAMCSMFNPISKITDLVGWNLYLGWYVPFKWLNDAWISLYHLFCKKNPLCYSEYGSEGMPNLHSSHPVRGDHTEEYQAIYHEYMVKCFKRHPYLWGTYVWNMFDFAADARDQGGEPGMNHKGLMTYDRKTKKDSFYLYKCYWNKEPMIHICSKRYVNRVEKKTLVKVYSNQDEVELYNNGKLIKKLFSKDHIFKFKVNLEKENDIIVKSGGLTDETKIIKVSKKDPSYILKKGKSQNWVK
ncbi:MAG: glycoside hydrolase family 2 TIM barrel-domain containing protein [Bacillales bacterium]|nr:glycoside hydrolase family 2 TIM barrel-domain containing protein [Bacillales bacterium]